MPNLNEILVNLGIKVGPIRATDGTLNALRSGKQGEAIMAQAHGKYFEAAYRRQLYYSHVAGVTMTAPHTTNVGHIIWNPPDSGVLCVLGKWNATYKVTDADAMELTLCYSAQATLPGSVTASTNGPCYLGAVGVSDSKCKAYSAATITTAPTVICGMVHLTAAINTVGEYVTAGDFDGAFIAPPGYLFALHTIATAGSSGIGSSLIWEEVPII